MFLVFLTSTIINFLLAIATKSGLIFELPKINENLILNDTLILPYEIGLIGETAVQNTFPVDNSPLFEEGHTNNYQIPSKKQTLSDLKKDLKEIGITIDTQTKDILKDTMRGLDDIKAGIKEKYGKFEILGHGESRNGF